MYIRSMKKSLSWNLNGKVLRTISSTALFARMERPVAGKTTGRDVIKSCLCLLRYKGDVCVNGYRELVWVMVTERRERPEMLKSLGWCAFLK